MSSNFLPAEMSRRSVLASLIAGGFAARVGAADPIVRGDGSLLKLSLAAYSFHRKLPNRKTKAESADAPFTLAHFIDYCAAQKLEACELTSYYFPTDIDAAGLLAVKERCFRLGLTISGTAIGNDFCVAAPADRDKQLEAAKLWIDRAAVIGAPVIRIFAGNVPKGDTEDAARSRCVELINTAVEYAASKGVALALENHGGITATPDQMLRIVEAVKPSPWFGVNFDSGNFRTDDPYRDLARIAPFALNAQIKVEMFPSGRREPTDLARVVGILRSAGYRGFVALEYEAAEDPATVVPQHLAALRVALAG